MLLITHFEHRSASLRRWNVENPNKMIENTTMHFEEKKKKAEPGAPPPPPPPPPPPVKFVDPEKDGILYQCDPNAEIGEGGMEISDAIKQVSHVFGRYAAMGFGPWKDMGRAKDKVLY
jgi:hypothetical protein